MAKDKFKEMQRQGGGVLSSFNDAVATAAAATAQGEQTQNTQKTSTAQLNVTPVATRTPGGKWQEIPQQQEERYVRLPNPQIPIREYNLVSIYCGAFPNMTRQDWVELAIIEKLYNDQQINDDVFQARRDEIRSRPPRGQRKGLKASREGGAES